MFKGKRLFFTAVMLVLAMFIAGCGSSSSSSSNEGNGENGAEEETIKLKLATAQPATSNFTKLVSEPFMERVTELTDGKVQFEFYPAEQLGKAQDLLNLTINGVTDIAYFAPSYTPDQMPISANLIAMPGLVKNSHQGSMAYFHLTQKEPVLETDFLRHGVRPILGFTTPPYEIFSTKKIVKEPSDLKGMKIRSAGGVINSSLEFAQATPLQLSMPDTFEGFQTGIIDGSHMDVVTLADFGLDEIITHATKGMEFSVAAVGFIINEKVYQSLPEDVQKAILQAGEEVSGSSSKGYDAIVEDLFKELEEAGKNVYTYTDADKELWRGIYNEFNEKWQKEQNSEQFNEALKIFKEELAKFE